ncbi:MAG: peptidoglycan-binding protein, partial [Campylobacteraceae bacterium]|nr:peptidoglycan-binding protein [Campylobacteraceae bacterium]
TKLDGVYGNETRTAVRAYQGEMGMSQGALTLRTLQSLGVM